MTRRPLIGIVMIRQIAVLLLLSQIPLAAQSLDLFGPASTYFGVGGDPRSIATGDFNGDGRLDLATANFSGHNVSILLNSGAGAFGTPISSAPILRPETGLLVMPYAIATGDFNRDGKLDVVTANYDYSSQVSILLGDGNGSLGPANSLSLVNFGIGFGRGFSVAVGDFNQDEKLDLAVLVQYYGCTLSFLAVLPGNGDGTFSGPSNYVVGQNYCSSTPHFEYGDAYSVTAADVNADGKLDLVTANFGGQYTNSVLLGTGTGSFGEPAFIGSIGYSLAWAVAVGDLNGDGIMDLANSNDGAPNFTVLLGVGEGAFGPPSSFGAELRSEGSIAVADFDGDGKLDLARPNAGGTYPNRNLEVVLGTGAGSFGVATDFQVGVSPTGVAVGDFNDDGKMDVATADQGGHSVSVLLNTTVVVDTNHAPTVTDPGSQTSAEGASVSLQISATDPDGNTLTYSATGLPPGLSINTNTGLITGDLSYTAEGNYNVEVTASDGSLTGSTLFTWTVTNTNLPPTVANPGAQTSAEGASVSLQISATDPDGNTLTYSATGLPPGLSINTTTGLITGTVSYTATGTYSVKVTASDGSLTGSASFTWTVTALNTIGGKVTGAALTFGANGHSGLNVQADKTGVKGELEFQSGTLNFHAHKMTALTILPDGKKAWFSGVGTDGMPFTAYVEDNGEPGRNDVFKIWIGNVQYSDGRLTGGNIQIHK